MNKEEYKNQKTNCDLKYFSNKVNKINLDIQLDDIYQNKNEKSIKLPYIIKKRIPHNSENRKNLRRKLVQIGNFCQSIYTNSNTTLNNTKTMEDILNDTKIKSIEDIKNNYFINLIQPSKEEIYIRDNSNSNNDNINNSNNEIYKRIIYNKSKPKSLKKINIKASNKNSNNEEKFTYLTTTYERKEKDKINNIHYSIDNSKNRRIKYNYGDYASNKLIINHPKLYILNNNNYRNNKLPMINTAFRRINIIEEFSQLIPDNYELAREEKINKYDEYMKAKELKEFKNA